MGYSLMHDAMNGSKSKGSARVVLFTLAFIAKQGGKTAYPSLQTIARCAGISRRSAINAVHKLEALGEVVVFRTPRGRGRNIYKIILPKYVRKEYKSSWRKNEQTSHEKLMHEISDE